MKELKCPQCGNVFSVDEADYASIVSQVKNAEFDLEVSRRLAELRKQMQAEQTVESTKTASEYAKQMTAKDSEISQLKSRLNALEEQKKAELANAVLLKAQEMQQQLVQKDSEIQGLKATIAQNSTTQQMAVMQEHQKMQNILKQKEVEIEQIKAKGLSDQNVAIQKAEDMRRSYDEQVKMLKDQVDYYKDLKAKMSTKMVGETLEQHCSVLFNQMLRPVMPNAYFEKDNDVADGTKGDFVFRDSEDGVEYVSVMFEMKNEMDTTSTKHKNEDFLKKLDDDRNKKNCEFAVLVSLLEPDNELYNGGIVDMSHRYPKMYVIRPQFFIPLVTLLVQTSKKSLDYKKQLAIAQSQSIDVTNFENELNDVKEKIGNNYRLAAEKFKTAIDEIDKSITHLQKIKDALMGSTNNFRLANEKAKDLTVKKLTKKSPMMRQLLEDVREVKSEE